MSAALFSAARDQSEIRFLLSTMMECPDSLYFKPPFNALKFLSKAPLGIDFSTFKEFLTLRNEGYPRVTSLEDCKRWENVFTNFKGKTEVFCAMDLSAVLVAPMQYKILELLKTKDYCDQVAAIDMSQVVNDFEYCKTAVEAQNNVRKIFKIQADI